MMQAFWSTIFVVAIAACLAACGDDSRDDLRPSPTFPAISIPAREAGPATVDAYLADTGIEGKKGRLTDPIDCAALADNDAPGDFCIVDDASVYATALAIMFVADVDNQDEDIWWVRAEQGPSVWDITSVEKVPTE